MKYRIDLDNDNYVEGYIVDVNGQYSDEDIIKIFDSFNHRINCYKKVDDNYVLDSAKEEEIIAKEEEEAKKQEKESQRLEAQILYTAVCTDTLLESEVE